MNTLSRLSHTASLPRLTCAIMSTATREIVVTMPTTTQACDMTLPKQAIHILYIHILYIHKGGTHGMIIVFVFRCESWYVSPIFVPLKVSDTEGA